MFLILNIYKIWVFSTKKMQIALVFDKIVKKFPKNTYKFYINMLYSKWLINIT